MQKRDFSSLGRILFCSGLSEVIERNIQGRKNAALVAWQETYLKQ